MQSQTRVRVRYSETDQMGVVYHANYFIWMELGRVEYCRSIGVIYRDMERDDGILLAVAEANCRYLYPARYDDEVVITTRLARSNPRMVRFEYKLTSATDDRTLATGHTAHIFLNREMRPAKLPEKYRPLFGL
jgi:acyl-CoA thioester hydrolase